MAKLLRRLVDMQYQRNDIDFSRGKFRVRGDTLEVQPAYEDTALRIEFFGDTVDRIMQIDPLTGEIIGESNSIDVFPAKHFVTSHDKLILAIETIKRELQDRLLEFRKQDKLLEAARLEQRTNYDLEMLRRPVSAMPWKTTRVTWPSAPAAHPGHCLTISLMISCCSWMNHI
jgi:excinuclease ABC subunit B